ncbi:MAG: thiamine pyrophosphate-binding protein, partial [Acidimicrobiales bacterium]
AGQGGEPLPERGSGQPGEGHARRRHGGTLLAEVLAEHGVTHVFGVPGGQTLALYDGILDRSPAMSHVLVRDERSAAYAADGYARVTGRVGVCDATVGPGAAKLPSGLGEALGASVPLVALVSDLPTASAPHRYRGAASQALEQAALLAPVTKWQATVPDAGSLPALVSHAFREATTGRPGPVALLLPQDVLDGDVEATRPSSGPAGGGAARGGAGTTGGASRFGTYPSVRVLPDPADLAAAAALLRASARPAIVAGGGVLHSGAGPAVTALSERISAAVATTLSGKGAISERHPLAVGVLGSMGTTSALHAVDEADLVLLVGTKAGSGSTFGWSRPRADQTVIRMDVDPVEVGRAFAPAAALVGDARLAVEALLAELGREPPAGSSPAGSADRSPAGSADRPPDRQAWRSRIGALVAGWRKERDSQRGSDAVPIAPQRVMRELEQVLGEQDVVVCDASLSSGWGGVYLEQACAGRRVISPRGFAGLGYALPAAVGVAIARPGSRTVVLTGDGALGYAVGEMATVIEHGLPITVVVLNNSSLGWIRWYRRITFGRGWEAPDFADVAYAEVARGFGWTAQRVTDPGTLGDALRGAMRCEGPSLVDVVTETWETPIAGHRSAAQQPGALAGYGG